jgi:hypothetical protein
MASTRAFKNLANLRDSFHEPIQEEGPRELEHGGATNPVHIPALTPFLAHQTSMPGGTATERSTPMVSPITGRVDRRRLRKVLKTPSVSLSVAIRTELHEQVSEMLFARKTTWIALLDELLADYVAQAKQSNRYPK